MADTTTLIWDFFGPRAEGTAAHFARHVAEFLAREAIAGCAVTTEALAPGHHAAYCRTPQASVAVLTRALRPRRALESKHV